MAFSGGTYTLPAGNPVVTGTTIQSSWANTTLSDIATALSTCVLKDGTQTLTANIPMGGFKLTGLGAGSSANDSVRVAQLQLNTANYLTGVAGTNTITATASPSVASLTAGQEFTFIPANTNTGATTLQIDSSAATNVFWNGAALVGGEIRQNVPVKVMYDGTQYQLLSSAAMANTFATPDSLRIQSLGDRTKQIVFLVSGVTTATTRTITIGDRDFAIGKGPTRQVVIASGSGTYITPTGATYLYVKMVGGGGGGGAVTTNAGAVGTDTTFGTLTASHGAGGGLGGSGGGGAGGTGTNGDINIGGGGGCAGTASSVANILPPGGIGGNSVFGGGGSGGQQDTAGSNAGVNSGGGGGGAGGASTTNSGSGGGAGGYVEKLILSPVTSYAYFVGGGGAGGAAGVRAGGNGAAGIIIVDEFYN